MARVLNRGGPDAAFPAAPVPAASMLEVGGLSLGYPGTASRVLERLDLRVASSERLMVLGRSGCGKSTLLKAIAGFTTPLAGWIRVGGRPVTGPGPDRAVVFQEFDQLPPWKTVLENVAFPLRVARRLGREESRERAAAWLERVHLGHVADRYPHTLSGGMKQRVAIARALALQPAMLLMDEPFAALDAITRRAMQDELLALCEETRPTLLFVTHSIDEALILGSRIAVLAPDPGRLVAERAVPGDEAGRRELGRLASQLIGDDDRDAALGDR